MERWIPQWCKYEVLNDAKKLKVKNWTYLVNTSPLRGVLVLRSLARQLSGRSTSTSQFLYARQKKTIGDLGFTFVPLHSSMIVVSVTLFSILQDVELRMLDSLSRALAQQIVLTFYSRHAFVLSELTPKVRRNESSYPSPSIWFWKCQGALTVVSWCLVHWKQNGKSWTEF
jgi:hypothetical protein